MTKKTTFNITIEIKHVIATYQHYHTLRISCGNSAKECTSAIQKAFDDACYKLFYGLENRPLFLPDLDTLDLETKQVTCESSFLLDTVYAVTTEKIYNSIDEFKAELWKIFVDAFDIER